MSSLFGTSGIRGSAKELLTDQFCFDVGRTFSKFLAGYNQNKKIIIGRDSRESSERIRNSFVSGVQYENFLAVDQGICPVPAINFLLIDDASLGGGCMITGSHIKADFNGFKFFAFKEEISKKHEAEIEEIYKKIAGEINFQEKNINIPVEDRATERYIEMLVNLADKPLPDLKIALDLCNGCQSVAIPDVLRRIGLEFKAINGSLVPKDFIARDTETKEAAEPIQELMKKESFDIGIIYDGDGDRVVFVDRNGNFIPGDYSGSLIGKYSESDTLVTPINSSQVADNVGKTIVRTRVGSPFVVEAMKKYNASFGFEANGGGFSREVMMSRDGGSTTIKILNLIKKTRKSFEEMIDELPKFYLYRTKVDCPRELNEKILSQAKIDFQGKKIEETDGLKIWLTEDSWILFRASSNAPEFRVFTEAGTKLAAEEIGERGINFVKSMIQRA
jgi:phosphomannomutase/phosphoglucomutase